MSVGTLPGGLAAWKAIIFEGNQIKNQIKIKSLVESESTMTSCALARIFSEKDRKERNEGIKNVILNKELLQLIIVTPCSHGLMVNHPNGVCYE